MDTLSGSDLIELMSLREADGEDYTENDQRKVCVAGRIELHNEKPTITPDNQTAPWPNQSALQ